MLVDNINKKKGMNAEIDDLEKLAHNKALEESPEYQRILPEVTKEVDAQLEAVGLSKGIGVCHLAWATQKQILKEKYGITWYTSPRMSSFDYL